MERFKVQQTLDHFTRRANHLSPQLLKTEILENIQRTGIDFLPEDFVVIEEQAQKYVTVKYQREVIHPFGYVTVLEFDLQGKP